MGSEASVHSRGGPPRHPPWEALASAQATMARSQEPAQTGLVEAQHLPRGSEPTEVRCWPLEPMGEA